MLLIRSQKRQRQYTKEIYKKNVTLLQEEEENMKHIKDLEFELKSLKESEPDKNHKKGNTENKCAIRTLTVDGNKEGIVVLPHRGRDNWDEYGWSNSVKAHLTPGNHTIGLTFRPENENMNIHTNHAVISGIKLVKD